MKNILLTTVLILFTSLLYAQSGDFRGLEWGANIKTVKLKENARFVIEKDNYLEYRSTLGDYDADLRYLFNKNDELMGAEYVIRNKFTNPQYHFEEYDFFADLLTEKYGKAVKRSIITTKTDSRNENLYTSLLKEGKFSQETKWDAPNTEVKLVLSGSGSEVILTIEYLSKKYKVRNQELKKEMVLKYL